MYISERSRIFQLDYKVTSKKLREVFKMAGTVVDVDLKEDQEGKSRGMAVVKYEHPVEAVQVRMSSCGYTFLPKIPIQYSTSP